jgi:hypothetical protein
MGRNVARNHGIRASHGSVILSIDGDMVADTRLVQKHFERQMEGAATCIGVRQYANPYPGISARTDADFAAIRSHRVRKIDPRERMYEHTDDLRASAEPFWAFRTCNVSYSKVAAITAGFFDETIMGWGMADQEFAYRLWRTSDAPFVLLRDAIAIHLEHPRDSRAEGVTLSQNRAAFVKKHGPIFMITRREQMWRRNTSTTMS